MSNTALLVTGASGKLGRRVLEILVARQVGQLIATTRNPASLAEFVARGVEVRAADFDDEASLAKAFAGAQRALLISTDALDRPGHRVAQHQAAIRAFGAVGVEHAVYTSLPNAETSVISIAKDHAATEVALSQSSLGFTILRNNMYAEMLLGSLPAAIATGELVNARGDGRVAFVTRDDCAEVAAAALAERSAPRRETFDVTGPSAIDNTELVRLVERAVGRPLIARSVAPEILAQGLSAHGLPPYVVELITSFDTGIARGELERVTDSVQRFTARPARPLGEFLAEHAAALGGAP